MGVYFSLSNNLSMNSPWLLWHLLGAKLTPVLLLCCPILNIHLTFHDLRATPALLSSQLQSSQWKEGSGEKRRPYSFLLGTRLRSCTRDFCLHPIGQNLVTWFRHTREVGKCSPYSGYPFAQLRFRTLLLKQGEEMDIGCQLTVSVTIFLKFLSQVPLFFLYQLLLPTQGGNSAS